MLIIGLILAILYVAQDRRPLPEPTEPPLEELLEEPLSSATYRIGRPLETRFPLAAPTAYGLSGERHHADRKVHLPYWFSTSQNLPTHPHITFHF